MSVSCYLAKTFVERTFLVLLLSGLALISPITGFDGDAVAQPPPGIFTYHYQNTRVGLNPNETILTPGNVNQSSFGLLFTDPVIGQVYAQPLYVSAVTIQSKVHNVVYVATEQAMVYAFDADRAGPALSSASLLGPGEQPLQTTDTHCGDLQPKTGVTGTPVIDPDTRTLYVVTRSKLPGTTIKYFVRLHALDITNLAMERVHFPVVISGSVAGTGDGSVSGKISFVPILANQRMGLLLARNGSSGKKLYIAFASDCDAGKYHGWVFEYDPVTGQQDGILNSTPNGFKGGIWSSGGAPAEDSEGNIYLSVGNGTYDPPNANYGDSVLRLQHAQAPSHKITVSDFFTPSYQCMMAAHDFDMGSAGVVLLGESLLATADKYGTIYLLDSSRLGGGPKSTVCPSPAPPPPKTPVPPSSCANSRTLPECFLLDNPIPQNDRFFGTPAFWNSRLYVVPILQKPEAYSLSNGLLSTKPVDKVPASAHFIVSAKGITPVVSANARSNGILWVLDDGLYQPQAGDSGAAILYAFDAMNLSKELYASDLNPADNPGKTIKFTIPTVINGKVYVGTQTTLAVYGLRHPPTPSATPTRIPTTTRTPTPTATRTPTPRPTTRASATASATPTSTASPTPSATP